MLARVEQGARMETGDGEQCALHGRDDAEVALAAKEGAEEVGVRLRGDMMLAAVRGHYVDSVDMVSGPTYAWDQNTWCRGL